MPAIVAAIIGAVATVAATAATAAVTSAQSPDDRGLVIANSLPYSLELVSAYPPVHGVWSESPRSVPAEMSPDAVLQAWLQSTDPNAVPVMNAGINDVSQLSQVQQLQLASWFQLALPDKATDEPSTAMVHAQNEGCKAAVVYKVSVPGTNGASPTTWYALLFIYHAALSGTTYAGAVLAQDSAPSPTSLGEYIDSLLPDARTTSTGGTVTVCSTIPVPPATSVSCPFQVQFSAAMVCVFEFEANPGFTSTPAS